MPGSSSCLVHVKHAWFMSSKKEINVACSAYNEKVQWSKIFHRDVLNFFKSVAKNLNSRIDIVLPLLLANTSALICRDKYLQVVGSRKMKGNIFLLTVGKVKIGKSPANQNLVELPFRNIEEDLHTERRKRPSKILTQDCIYIQGPVSLNFCFCVYRRDLPYFGQTF